MLNLKILLLGFVVFEMSTKILSQRPKLYTDNEKDKDIQEALIGVTRKLPRECPMVLIYDEQMPELSISHLMMKRIESFERLFIIVNLSSDKLGYLQSIYGSNSTDRAAIVHHLLHYLYRKGKCYTFLFWVKDPRILYPDTTSSYHPGWRRSDFVILIAHHINKKFRALINLRIWTQIPNIIALKRNKDELEGVAIFIYTVLPYYKNGRRKAHEIDVWLVQERRFRKNNTLFFEKFKNLYDSTLFVGVVWKEPFFIWGNHRDPWLDGIDWRLLGLCQKSLNFVLNNVISIPSTGRKSGGKWSGLFGQLENRAIDVGVGGISITAERRQYFDFCRTYYTDSYNFIAPLNFEIKTALNTFYRPLSNGVWLGTFVSVVIGVITLKVVANLETYLRTRDFDSRSHFNSLVNNCGFVITIFFQKPYRHVPTTLASQCVYFGMIIMTFLLGMAFSSCLISVLLGFKPQPIADKVEDILKTKLPIAIKNYDGRLNEYMNNSNSAVIKKIFKRGKLVNFYQSFKAMDDVVRGKMIYIDSKAKLQFSGKYRYAAGPNALKFHISSDAVLEFDSLGWPVNRNWPLLMKFDDIISRAVEGGIIQHWMSIFQRGRFGRSSEAWRIPLEFYNLTVKNTRSPHVVVPSDNDARVVQLTMEHVSGVFTFYIVGVLIAILIFIGECVTGICIAICKLVKRIRSRQQKPAEKVLNDDKNVAKSKGKKKQKIAKQNHKVKGLPDLVWNDFSKVLVNKKLS